MKVPPVGFDLALLVDALERQWQLRVRELVYCPVGFGAHHWRLTTTGREDLFLAVHDLDLVGRGGADRSANFRVLQRTFSAAN